MTQDPEHRRGRASGRRDSDARTDFHRDRDRLVYASAFRRLAGVTQTAAAGELQLLHNRLTHSLKVEQVALALCARVPGHTAESLDLQPEVAACAALAHDIGHPPFGHVAEAELDRHLRLWGGFEGNAQSFRIITKLSVHRRVPLGLDLTYASLSAILKYPQFEPPSEAPLWTDRWRGSKWGVYPSEREIFGSARQGLLDGVRSAEALIMDWADDVAYATHDIDDYVRGGLIPLERIPADIASIVGYVSNRLTRKHGKDFKLASLLRAQSVLETLPREPYRDRLDDRRGLHQWVSDRLEEFGTGLRILDAEPYLEVDEATQYRVELLKGLTWFYVIDSPRLAVGQRGQARVVGELFELLTAWMEDDPESARLPIWLRELHELFVQQDPGRKAFEESVAGRRGETDPPWDAKADPSRLAVRRAVSDYICSLTEAQALDLHAHLTGRITSHGFNGWVS